MENVTDTDGTMQQVGQKEEKSKLENMSQEEVDNLLKKYRNDKRIGPMLKSLEGLSKKHVAQAQDSQTVIEHKRGVVDPEVLARYPDSPTAERHLVAYRYYMEGCLTIYNYGGSAIKTEKDCCEIQPGFHSYAKGFLLENHMAKQFPLNPTFLTLANQYLVLRPNDSIVEFLKVILSLLSFEHGMSDMSEYEKSKEKIRGMEMLVYKLLPFKKVETEKNILICLYDILGSHYTITYQAIRALDSFTKCHELDTTKHYSLYAVAFSEMENKRNENAISLFHKYVEKAPKCDDKYPNGLYFLGLLYFTQYNDAVKAVKYYRQGMEAEEKWRLPFQGPVDLPAKTLLKSMVDLGITDLKNKPGKKTLKYK